MSDIHSKDHTYYIKKIKIQNKLMQRNQDITKVLKEITIEREICNIKITAKL